MFYFFDKAVEVNIAMLHAFINIKTASIATQKLNGAATSLTYSATPKQRCTRYTT